MNKIIKEEDLLSNESRAAIIDIAEKHLPTVQAKAFCKYVENSEIMKQELKEAHDKIKQLNKCICDRDNTISTEQKISAELRDRVFKKSELDAKEIELISKDQKLNVEKQLIDMQLICEKEKSTVVKDMFNTVFRPGTLRKEVQREVGRVLESGEHMEYDSYQNRNVPVSDGQSINTCMETDETTITDE